MSLSTCYFIFLPPPLSARFQPSNTSQPASTSLLLRQRLSKGIILLFLTPLFLHPSVFLSLSFLLGFVPRPRVRLATIGRLAPLKTRRFAPAPQGKFIQLKSPFPTSAPPFYMFWDAVHPTLSAVRQQRRRSTWLRYFPPRLLFESSKRQDRALRSSLHPYSKLQRVSLGENYAISLPSFTRAAQSGTQTPRQSASKAALLIGCCPLLIKQQQQEVEVRDFPSPTDCRNLAFCPFTLA